MARSNRSIAAHLRRSPQPCAMQDDVRRPSQISIYYNNIQYLRLFDRGRDDIFAAPFGMPGVPTLWPAMFTWAVDLGVPLPTPVRAMSEMPARLLGLAHLQGTLLPGADADIILIDPSARQTVDAQKLWPNVSPSPLVGESLAGWPYLTMSRGEVVGRDGELAAVAGRGESIRQGGIWRGKQGPRYGSRRALGRTESFAERGELH